jgi:multidrug efflux pump subunit AcrA (membrane-fusion protein)
VKDTAAAEAKAAADAVQRQAELDAARRRQDEAVAAAAASRQAELDLERRQKEAAEAAQRQADFEAEERRKAEAERVAAEDAARRKAEEDEKRQAEERVRTASAVLSAEERSTFVRRVQLVLKDSKCYDGGINGSSGETQDDLNRFVASAHKKGRPKPARIELAKATASDFEAWLRDADDNKGVVCSAPTPPKAQEAAKPKPHKQQEAARPRSPRQREREEAPHQRAERPEREPSSGSGGGLKLCSVGARQMAVCN